MQTWEEKTFDSLVEINRKIDNFVIKNALWHNIDTSTLQIRNVGGLSNWIYRLTMEITNIHHNVTTINFPLLSTKTRIRLLSQYFQGHFYFNGNKRRRYCWELYFYKGYYIPRTKEEIKEFEDLIFK